MKPMPYQDRITTAMQHLPITPGTVSTVSVQHDAGCPMLAGRPVCRCVPDIYISTAQGRARVGVDGSVTLPAARN